MRMSYLVLLLLLTLCVAGSGQQNSKEPEWIKICDGLNFPEGPAWDGASSLFVSNCYGGWLLRVRADKPDTFLLASNDPFTFEKTNGLIVDRKGDLLACDFGVGAILRIKLDGSSERYVSQFDGKPFNRPNDLCMSPDGDLYFTDPSSYGRNKLDGRVFKVDQRTKKVTEVADSLGFPNGIVFSKDGKRLYVCESAFERVLGFNVGPDGELSHKTIFVELPGGDPDGLALDLEGNIVVAHFGGGAVYVVSPEGIIQRRIPTPGKKPTNIEFGGADLRDLYLTEVETSALYKLRIEP